MLKSLFWMMKNIAFELLLCYESSFFGHVSALYIQIAKKTERFKFR